MLAPDTPVEFNEDQSLKKIVVDAALKNIASGNILAEFSTVPDLKHVEIEFHKNHEIKSLRVLKKFTTSNKTLELNDKFFNFTSNGGDFKSVASKVLFYDNGNIACEYHGEDVTDVALGRIRGADNHMKFVNVDDKVSGFSFLDYYDINGNLRLSMVYLIKDKFITLETALVEFDKEQNVVNIIEDQFYLNSNLLFNDDLIPTGYTKIDSSIYEFPQEIIERLSN